MRPFSKFSIFERWDSKTCKFFFESINLITCDLHTYKDLFTSQYLEEFRVPCSAVVLIYLNEEVLLLHSSFSHQQFFFLSIALVLSPHFIFKSLFLARHTFSLLFLCVYVCEGWNNPESALVFPHTVLDPL